MVHQSLNFAFSGHLEWYSYLTARPYINAVDIINYVTSRSLVWASPSRVSKNR